LRRLSISLQVQYFPTTFEVSSRFLHCWKGHLPMLGISISSGGQNDDFRPLTYNPWWEGHGAQGQICDILRPQLVMNRFLPLWLHRFPHFGYIHLGGGGGGALILDRCRVFDLFASVDARVEGIFYWKSSTHLLPSAHPPLISAL
jgi:hypothetical protein